MKKKKKKTILNNVKVQLYLMKSSYFGDTKFLHNDNLQQTSLDTLNQSTTDAAYLFEHCILNLTWSFNESNHRVDISCNLIWNQDLAAFVLPFCLEDLCSVLPTEYWVTPQTSKLYAGSSLSKINTVGLQGKSCRAQEGQQAEWWLILKHGCRKWAELLCDLFAALPGRH